MMGCESFFSAHRAIALAFSGGVDSSYLLYEGLRCGAAVAPFFVKTAFQPAFELEDARRVCSALGAALRVIELDILSDEAITCNSADRCYPCKMKMLSAVCAHARKEGLQAVCDGTNMSDDDSDRPGMRAVRALGVWSPLRICGLTKAEIRRLSKEAGLDTWDKPAYACLATRIPNGMTITQEWLSKVEAAEDKLTRMGFLDFRARVLPDGGARLQVRGEQMALAVEKRRQILMELKPHFASVSLDLEGRV